MVVAEVRNFAVLDVQPCLPHVVLSPAITRFAAVGDHFRDGADVRPTTRMTFLIAVLRGVPSEHLKRGQDEGGGGVLDIQTRSAVRCSASRMKGELHTAENRSRGGLAYG